MSVVMKYGSGRESSGKSGGYGDSGFLHLVWENPNPTSSFAAQTIDVDLTDYDWFAIETRWSTSSALVIPLCIYKVDETRHIISLSNDASNRTGGRQFTYSIADQSLAFEGGYYNEASSNVNVIPIAIYGISCKTVG